MSSEQYRNWLIVIASAAETILMILFGLTFLIAPTPSVFKLMRDNGIFISPPLLAIFVFCFILCYPTLLSQRARKRWTTERRHQLFLFGAAPVYLYFIAVIVISIQMHRITIGNISFLGVCLVIIILPSALFYGYRRSLEMLSCMIMAGLTLITALAFAFMPPVTLFLTINQDFNLNLVPMGAALTFLASSLGYFSILLAGHHIRPGIKRIIFGVLALPVGLVGANLVYNVLRTYQITSLITPLAIINLAVVIVLLGLALYQPSWILHNPLEDDYREISST